MNLTKQRYNREYRRKQQIMKEIMGIKKKPAKTGAERMRELRQRKKAAERTALINSYLSKSPDSSEMNTIIDALNFQKKPAKTNAERLREYRLRKKAAKLSANSNNEGNATKDEIYYKKPVKTAAQRSREYRMRKKIAKQTALAEAHRSTFSWHTTNVSNAFEDEVEIYQKPAKTGAKCKRTAEHTASADTHLSIISEPTTDLRKTFNDKKGISQTPAETGEGFMRGLRLSKTVTETVEVVSKNKRKKIQDVNLSSESAASRRNTRIAGEYKDKFEHSIFGDFCDRLCFVEDLK